MNDNDEIKQGNDGIYRWVYEYSMLKNPTILFTVWKVLLISVFIIYFFTGIINLFDGYDSFSEFWDFTKVFLYIGLGALVLGFIAYLIVAAMYGWKYMILFEMSETEITHIQIKSQFKKAEALGWLTAAVGALSMNPTVAGSGMLAATRNTLTSEYKKVKTVTVKRGRNLIKLDGLLSHNQIYANKKDFDFVLDYICKRVDAKAIKDQGLREKYQ